MASKTRPVSPATKQLRKSLPGLTNDELLMLTADLQVALGARASTITDALFEMEEPPRDAINDALVFVERAECLFPILHNKNKRVVDAWHIVHAAQKDLHRLLDGDGASEDDDD